MSRNFFLIRHGQTTFNARKVISGWDEAELTPLGMQQAECVGMILSELGPISIFASDLLRARQTAQGVLKHLKGEAQFVDALRERHYGEFGGKPVEDYRKALADSGGNDERFCPVGGETKSVLRARVLPYLDSLLKQDLENILLVGHHGTNKVILSHLLGETENSYQQSNCCINELVIYKNHLEIKRLNCVKHLSSITDG